MNKQLVAAVNRSNQVKNNMMTNLSYALKFNQSSVNELYHQIKGHITGVVIALNGYCYGSDDVKFLGDWRDSAIDDLEILRWR